MAEVRRKFVDCARHGGIANAEALFDLLGNLAAVVDLRALAIRPVP
jgi:hypothetical protein